MAPNLREGLNKDVTSQLSPANIFAFPENDSISLSDVEIWTNSDDPESEEENIPPFWNIPLQNDLRDLLLKVTATEDLATVTQVKLKVITREISLQQLSIYTPALRELILDGSHVSSLRDLGCGLKNLKILRLNRCNLNFFDSMSGIENLEEIYATDNYLAEISPCGFLPMLKVIDVRRNKIATRRGFFFLSLCTELQHLNLEGNPVVSTPNFTMEVKRVLPTLAYLDGVKLEGHEEIEGKEFNIQDLKEEPAQTRRHAGSFVIDFPPRVLRGSEEK